MKRWFAGCALTAALASVSGCASDPALKPMWTIGPAFNQIQAGRSTKDDVFRELGKPIHAMTLSRLSEEVWDYRFTDGAVMMYGSVHFDNRGVVTYFTSEPDPAHYSGQSTDH